MKKFSVNKIKYIIFPSIISIIILTYFIFIFSKSYTYINVLNISFDAIILIYYFYHFCTEVRGDSEKIYFYTLLRKKCVTKKEIYEIANSSFLSSIKCSKGHYYIFINGNKKSAFDEIFGEINKK